jgi:hypothetical protein
MLATFPACVNSMARELEALAPIASPDSAVLAMRKLLG